MPTNLSEAFFAQQVWSGNIIARQDKLILRHFTYFVLLNCMDGRVWTVSMNFIKRYCIYSIWGPYWNDAFSFCEAQIKKKNYNHFTWTPTHIQWILCTPKIKSNKCILSQILSTSCVLTVAFLPTRRWSCWGGNNDISQRTKLQYAVKIPINSTHILSFSI